MEPTYSKVPAPDKSPHEHLEALGDYAKHITTLAAGTIVFVSAFAEKVGTGWIIRFALGLMLLSMIAGLFAQGWSIVSHFGPKPRLPRTRQCFTLAQVAFGFGIALIAISIVIGP